MVTSLQLLALLGLLGFGYVNLLRIRLRRGWVPSRHWWVVRLAKAMEERWSPSSANEPPPPKSAPDSGARQAAEQPNDKLLRFDYADKYGRVSTRALSAWTEDRSYIHGFDEVAGGDRTFAKARVIRIINGGGVSPTGVGQKYKLQDEGRAGRVAIIGKSSPVKRFGPVLKGPVATPLVVEYVDRYGGTRFHQLHAWYEYERHISGWCTETRRHCSLVKAQVETWLTGSEHLSSRSE